MNTMIFPEDVDKVIQSFVSYNEGDEATQCLIVAIGADLLNIPMRTMMDRIEWRYNHESKM